MASIIFTVEDSIPTDREFKRACERGADDIMELIADDLGKITANDENPAVFSKSGSGLRQETGTSDPFFVRRNNGVPARTIYPKRAKSLRFQPNYKARTQKGVIGSNPGGHSGGYVHRKQANWPGIEAREHIKAVAEHAREAAPDLICDRIRAIFR